MTAAPTSSPSAESPQAPVANPVITPVPSDARGLAPRDFAGPVLVAIGLAIFRMIDIGSAGVILVWMTMFACIFYLQYVLRHAFARIISASMAHPGTLMRILLERRVLNAASAAVAALVLSMHLLCFLYLTQPIFFIFIFLDAFVVVMLQAALSDRFSSQLQTGAAAIVREITVILLNFLFLFSTYLATDLLLDDPVSQARMDVAIAEENASRRSRGGDDKSIVLVDDTNHRPIKIFDDRLPLLAILEVKHSSKPFQNVLRSVKYVDLNVKSIRLSGTWGVLLYWTIFLISMSFLPFMAITLLFRAIVRVPFALTFRPERSRL